MNAAVNGTTNEYLSKRNKREVNQMREGQPVPERAAAGRRRPLPCVGLRLHPPLWSCGTMPGRKAGSLAHAGWSPCPSQAGRGCWGDSTCWSLAQGSVAWAAVLSRSPMAITGRPWLLPRLSSGPGQAPRAQQHLLLGWHGLGPCGEAPAPPTPAGPSQGRVCGTKASTQVGSPSLLRPWEAEPPATHTCFWLSSWLHTSTTKPSKCWL